MSDTLNRTRKANLVGLTDEQADQLGDQIGAKIRGMIDDFCDKVNRLLNVYGLHAKVSVVIQEKEKLGE